MIEELIAMPEGSASVVAARGAPSGGQSTCGNTHFIGIGSCGRRFGPGGGKGAAGYGHKAKGAPPRASEAPRGGAPLIFGGGKVYPGR